MSVHKISILAIAFVVVFIGGCASLEIPQAKTIPTSTSQSSSATFKPITSKKLFPIKDTRSALKVTVGKHKGSVYNLKTSKNKDDKWKVSIKGHHIAYYHIDSSGQVVLDREDDLEEKVRVQYSPGIVILPAKLTQNKASLPKGKVKMQVFNLKTDKQRAKGTCTYAITSIKKVNLSTPAGTFESYLVKSDRKLDLSLAKVHVVILDGYSPGVGIVLKDVTTKTRAIGIFSDSSRSRLERAKAK